MGRATPVQRRRRRTRQPALERGLGVHHRGRSALTYARAQELLAAGGATACLSDSSGDAVESELHAKLDESIAYAFDSNADNVDSHIEVHLFQRGRFVGMVIFFDHAPFDLWEHDGERVLRLFEARLASAP